MYKVVRREMALGLIVFLGAGSAAWAEKPPDTGKPRDDMGESQGAARGCV